METFGKLKRTAFIEKGIVFNIIYAFTVTFDKFNVSLLNKINIFFLLQIV